MSHDDIFQREVLTQLGDIKALCATNAANNKALELRTGALESSNVRQWWVTAAIIPFSPFYTALRGDSEPMFSAIEEGRSVFSFEITTGKWYDPLGQFVSQGFCCWQQKSPLGGGDSFFGPEWRFSHSRLCSTRCLGGGGLRHFLPNRLRRFRIPRNIYVTADGMKITYAASHTSVVQPLRHSPSCECADVTQVGFV